MSSARPRTPSGCSTQSLAAVIVPAARVRGPQSTVQLPYGNPANTSRSWIIAAQPSDMRFATTISRPSGRAELGAEKPGANRSPWLPSRVTLLQCRCRHACSREPRRRQTPCSKAEFNDDPEKIFASVAMGFVALGLSGGPARADSGTPADLRRHLLRRCPRLASFIRHQRARGERTW